MSQPANQTLRAQGAAQLEVFWQKLAARGRGYPRGYPRVHANIPVHVDATQSGALEVATNDLSLRGMQVRCDRATAECLRPDAGAAGSKPVYPVSMQLHVSGLALSVKAQGRVVHLTLVPGATAADEVAIGIEFVGFANGGEKVLQRFLEQHMRPAGT